jgi:putative ABC transport system permease protein
MSAGYLTLGYGQVAAAAVLVAVSGALSLWLRLGFARALTIASARTAVQLLLVGLVLHWVFRLDRWPVVLALVLSMTLVAGATAVRRARRRHPGIWVASIGSVAGSAWLVTAFAVAIVVRPEPWYAAQYVIPFAGLVLGNTLTGISLALDRFDEELVRRKGEVETLLALGATSWEAAGDPIRRAVHAGLTPMINAMSVAGIVSLPGMMSGQLLAGVAPVQAVKYQVVVMFLLAAGTAFGTVAVVLLSYRRLFNRDHQFESDRITLA